MHRPETAVLSVVAQRPPADLRRAIVQGLARALVAQWKKGEAASEGKHLERLVKRPTERAR